ncbi:hypothetical protein S40285_00519 [Stachybotrys chlorohalonatus IBT 40285]|uniref:L-ornithine N(5)-oxygenase n=1 Tax=Stachybotrys chlorohalonatus (strain IBT 40285) TaxID=1283841 RepID=A0A084QN59_STAC4|nr:hypothetical protein S40285_00519 [Stachybotrys chlorohalonata IBT 40285]
MAILDAGSSVGGVWETKRLYPGLKTNNLLGMYEYPDFPMDPTVYGVKPGQHIPGHVIQAYLEAYSKRFAIFELIRFGTKVVSATHEPEGGWVLEIESTSQVDHGPVAASKLMARRLIVATGVTSQPLMPHIKGQEDYGRPLFHSKDFGAFATTLETSNRVTVFGGTKSGWDAAYAYATRGVSVDWVIRATGHGTCWMAPPIVTPLKKWLEKLVNTRLVHWFSPCIWGDDSGYGAIKSFWHGTAVGRAVVDGFWSILANDVMQLMGFDKHPETKKLKPTTEAMFTGTSFSILNYDTDFLELVRDGPITVHVADITHLSQGKVHLDDGKILESDAIVVVTGWTHVQPLKFLPEGIESVIGLPWTHPTARESLQKNGLASQSDLWEQADKEISSRFPRLKAPMKMNPRYRPITETDGFHVKAEDDVMEVIPQNTLTLYRFMVPGSPELLRCKDIAFAGAVMNFSTAICAHIQGLWITAYLDGNLARDPSSTVLAEPDDDSKANSSMSLQKVQYDTVLHNRFGKWRYQQGPGSIRPDFVFEAVPYFDMLMADLGLKVHRKNGWFKEMIDPYGPEDYREIYDEWLAGASRSKQQVEP